MQQQSELQYEEDEQSIAEIHVPKVLALIVMFI
jgi:hypothetical protein